MKPFFVAAVLVVSLQQKAVSAEPVTLPFHKKCVIRFATVDEGRVAISKKDRFLTALSRFDRQSRIQTDKPVSIDQFVDFVAKEVRAWEKEETERIRTAL